MRPACVWLTGLSGAGKTTLACALTALLEARGEPAVRVDGDDLRKTVSADLGFSPADRAENVRRAAALARAHVAAGATAIVALISPFIADRVKARALFAPGDFLEVYVHAPLAVCRARDPKGLYARAARGEVRELTGVDSPYEAPLAPELVIDTTSSDVTQSLALLEALLRSR